MKVLAIVGPTATGKSSLAAELASTVDGEIVNADSMQLYQGMDIGTAKPTPEQRDAVPHHLYDIWPVTHPASVAEYQRRALEVIRQIHDRGRLPVLVGGSGLYVRAVVDRIEFPGTDPQIRSRLEHELAAIGSEALHARLSTVDPAAAAAILPSNGRRIVRALEVIEMSGRPFSATLPTYTPDPGYCQIALDRDDLDERVDARVEQMWRDGFVEEVRGLLPLGIREGRTASRALGYAQVLGYLAGESTSDEAKERTALETRRFVRRQRSWFRRDPRVHWLDAAADTLRKDALAWCRAD
ncbi:MAG TPA: tRNA (adenosine(37)-N6)-dimethylallyltransferase MiaA [Mycobacteriales bacterium]|nr:tRNA (adenosine(37)-N6)-dimethylallyltransferase MiaA [Mycobacteriales bacterium]